MRSGTQSEQAAVYLLQDADRLLSAVLFWNLVINITYFAIASICSIRIEQEHGLGQTGAVVFALLSLLAIIFFSEMLPKSIGVIDSPNLSRVRQFPVGTGGPNGRSADAAAAVDQLDFAPTDLADF